MNIRTAKSIPLAVYLSGLGFQPVKRRGTDLWYLSPLRKETRASFKVNTRLNTWYDFGIGRGGNIISLAAEIYEMNDVSRLLRLIGANTPASVPFDPIQERNISPTEPEFKNVQVKSLAHPVLLDYLKSRKIDLKTAQILCKEVRYTVRGKFYFAVGFANDSGGYEIRNRYFKGAIPPKDTTWIRPQKSNRSCRLFEGFTDYLSYLTLCKQGDVSWHSSDEDFLILNSASLLPRAKGRLQGYEHIVCCLDRDTTGRRLVGELRATFGTRVHDDSIMYDGYKDLNDYLCCDNDRKLGYVKNWHMEGIEIYT